MLRLQVSTMLPYGLRLRDGEYQTSPAGDSIQVGQPPLAEGAGARTIVQAHFEHPESAVVDEQERQRVRDVDLLLRRTNRLLRWYRAVSHETEVIELTRAQASPFQFAVVGAGGGDGWSKPMTFEAEGPQPLALNIAELTDAVRNGLASGDEPEVAALFLFDAERALHEGRFREAVLFCWSTIDAVFNRKYDALVDAALVGEWREARDFFKGTNFGLRNKMSAVMHLIAQRSLFREPNGLWEMLTTSYNKRNTIIHQGVNASEDDARLAIEVARRIINVMKALYVRAEKRAFAEPSRAWIEMPRFVTVFT